MLQIIDYIEKHWSYTFNMRHKILECLAMDYLGRAFFNLTDSEYKRLYNYIKKLTEKESKINPLTEEEYNKLLGAEYIFKDWYISVEKEENIKKGVVI